MCPTLCDPVDSSPPGSPVPGILQARTLEWVAIFFSNAEKWKVKVKSLSRVRALDSTLWLYLILKTQVPWTNIEILTPRTWLCSSHISSLLSFLFCTNFKESHRKFIKWIKQYEYNIFFLIFLSFGVKYLSSLIQDLLRLCSVHMKAVVTEEKFSRWQSQLLSGFLNFWYI